MDFSISSIQISFCYVQNVVARGWGHSSVVEHLPRTLWPQHLSNGRAILSYSIHTLHDNSSVLASHEGPSKHCFVI